MKVEEIRCDRCGALMPHGSPRRRAFLTITEDKPLSYFAPDAEYALKQIQQAYELNDMSATIRVDTVFNYRDKMLDLCPKCTRELKQFLFNYKKPTVDESQVTEDTIAAERMWQEANNGTSI